MFRKLFLCVSFIFVVHALYADDEDLILKRIHNHILIEDMHAACRESSEAFVRYPHSKRILEAAIISQATAGNEKAMFTLWSEYVNRFPNDTCNRPLLESMAWGVLHKGSSSPMPLIRAITLLAALFSQDAKGVNILEKHLHDENAAVRKLSVKLASHLPDSKLQQGIVSILREDPSWSVRLEAIGAVGKMKLHEAKGDLLELLAKQHVSAEEKAAAIESLIGLLDDMDRKQILQLTRNPRAGLRQLACEVVEFLDLKNNIDLLYMLVDDSHAAVRVSALEAIGRLRVKSCGRESAEALFTRKLNDSDPMVAITAAWGLTFHQPEKGLKSLERWLQDDSMQVRLFTAGALAATGKHGTSLLSKAFNQAKDNYVKLNLALALINQKQMVNEACEYVYSQLIAQKDRWMWKEDGLSKLLVPGKSKSDAATGLLQSPEEVNQLVCLELFNTLAVMGYPQTQMGLKKFLMDRKWGVSALAASLLLTEGDEDSIAIVEGLLKDTSAKVRVQAALILALWGSGDEAVSELQKAYGSADRETKEHILEGLGRVGAPSSIEFLATKLQEPAQSLRMIAAAALLQALYH